MANQVQRKAVVAWLLSRDFEEVPKQVSGLRKFKHPDIPGAVSVPAHGPNDLTKQGVGQLLRQLERMGFNRQQVLDELTGKKKPRRPRG